MNNCFTSINPYNGNPIKSYPKLNSHEIEREINSLHINYSKWRGIGSEERKKWVLNLAQNFRDNKNQLAEFMALEMGKPISQGQSEIEKCAACCDYYAERTDLVLKDKIFESGAQKSYVTYDSLGLILGIMPWNFPFWQVVRFAVPNIMLGNLVLLKHAPNVQGCAHELEKLFNNSAPFNVLTNLCCDIEHTEHIIAHNAVRGVTLTGSTRAGSAVAALAGKHIKKSVLELGGSSAVVVFEDANLDKAVDIAFQSRFLNAGQSCIAGKRILLHKNIAQVFTQKFVKKVSENSVQNPLDSNTFIGPMARIDIAESLEKQMKASIEMGAKCLLGGTRNGTAFEPTILTDVEPNMPVFYEETFGPLAVLCIAKSDEVLLELASKTIYGLGCMLITENVSEKLKWIEKLNDGAVFFNEILKSDPRLPFGGTLDSGYGRELSDEGLLEFANAKTIYIH